MQPCRDRAALRSKHVSDKCLREVARMPVSLASLIFPRHHAHAASYGAHGDTETATDAFLIVHRRHPRQLARVLSPELERLVPAVPAHDDAGPASFTFAAVGLMSVTSGVSLMTTGTSAAAKNCAVRRHTTRTTRGRPTTGADRPSHITPSDSVGARPGPDPGRLSA